MAIRSFKHKGLKKFFENGDRSGIQAAHSSKIARILDRLHSTSDLKDMNAPGYNFHPLKGNFMGFYSVHINGNWTIIFRFANGDATDVDLIDYH